MLTLFKQFTILKTFIGILNGITFLLTVLPAFIALDILNTTFSIDSTLCSLVYLVRETMEGS